MRLFGIDANISSIRFAFRLIWIAFAAYILPPASAPQSRAQQNQQPPTFTLDTAAPSAQTVELTVAAPATFPVKIIRSGAAIQGGVTIDVTAFTNEQGITAPVLFSVGGKEGEEVSHLDNVAFDKPILALDLHVPPLPSGGKYTGSLILSGPSTSASTVPGAAVAPPTIWRFILTSASDIRPATLVIDQTAVTLSAVRPLCVWNSCESSEPPVVTVHARDKSGSWPLVGVSVRLEPGLKAPGSGFDPKVHIAASFNGAEADLFQAPPSPERQIPAHGQATISLAFKDLQAGEYTVPLRFTATNSGNDDAQRLAATLQVRNHVLWAIIVLVLGALVSFVATRIVTILRQRGTFLERLRSMRPAWLAEEGPTLPVIWLRAAFRQAEDLSKRFWLTGQSEIDRRLDAVKSVLEVLDQLRQVRNRIRTTIPEIAVQRRALWNLDKIMQQIGQQIGPGPLSEQDVTRVKAQLDELAKWCNPDQKQKYYWADVLPYIRALCTEVKGIPGADKLHTDLKSAISTEPTNLENMTTAEENYARLKILWELHDVPEAPKLTNKSGWPAVPIEQVYKDVDEFWWSRLKKPEAQLKVEGPSPDFSPLETYAPLTFRVSARDPRLRDSFLMRKKLIWQWTIEIDRTRRWAKKSQLGAQQKGQTIGKGSGTESVDDRENRLEVNSTEPQIAQYSPRSGHITAAVKITYDGCTRSASVPLEKPLIIRKSGDFRVWRIFETADIFAFVLALIVSVISGVATYALDPTYGSFTQYLALFIWGAGVDQGKNFLQSLAVYSPTSRAAS